MDTPLTVGRAQTLDSLIKHELAQLLDKRYEVTAPCTFRRLGWILLYIFWQTPLQKTMIHKWKVWFLVVRFSYSINLFTTTIAPVIISVRGMRLFRAIRSRCSYPPLLQIQSFGKPIEDNSQLADEWKVESLYFLVQPCAISFMEASLPTTTFAIR